MKISQIATILNDVIPEVLGVDAEGNPQAIVNEDLSNVVDIGKSLTSDENVERFMKKLQDRIGKTLFVDRPYEGRAPKVLMDGWEYGSILQKIRTELPESEKNPSWDLVNGQDYPVTVFKSPDVSQKFFNQKDTYQIHMSFAHKQVRSAFLSVQGVNGLFSMIEGRIRMRKTIDLDNLIMRTITTFAAATLYDAYGAGTETAFGAGTKGRAINLLYLYNSERGLTRAGDKLTAAECLHSLDFLKFAAYKMSLFSDRLEQASKLFNIGGTTKFTPKSLQKIVMLSEFARAADVYLQSDTFHNEFVKLPSADLVPFWQGTGENYGFDATSKIDVTIQNPKGLGTVSVETRGILAVIFDRDALGVCNVEDYVTSFHNPAAEFTNQWYKYDGSYFNDYDENGIVFFVADEE